MNLVALLVSRYLIEQAESRDSMAVNFTWSWIEKNYRVIWQRK
jgi:hypothetical protein